MAFWGLAPIGHLHRYHGLEAIGGHNGSSQWGPLAAAYHSWGYHCGLPGENWLPLRLPPQVTPGTAEGQGGKKVKVKGVMAVKNAASWYKLAPKGPSSARLGNLNTVHFLLL